MFKLETSMERDMFAAILCNTDQHTAWNIMNSIKRVPVVPGVCMVSIIQIAEYFEIPLQLVKKYTKYNGGSPYNNYPFDMKCVGVNELEEFALSKKRIKWNGLNYWELQFKDFTMVAPNTGLKMITPYRLLDFLLDFHDESSVAREIITEIIRDFHRYDGNWGSFGQGYTITQKRVERKIVKSVEVYSLKKRLMEYDEQEALKKKVLQENSILLEKEEFCQAVGEVISKGFSKEAETLFDKIHKSQCADVR